VGSNAILILAGFLVWAIAGMRVLAAIVQTGATPRTVLDLAAWLAFIAGFLVHVRLESSNGTRMRRWPALLIQSLCAIILAASAGGTGMEIALLVMVAGQLPGCVSKNASIAWVFAQTAVVFLVQLASPANFSWVGGIMFFGSYIAFQLFALGAASLAESEREAREALALAHAELKRMHGVALEGARHAERLRIARDLHDSLGHRLTALSLTLEAARHVAPADVPAKIGTARELTSALMDDLRASVGEIRDNETPELKSLLEGLARSVQTPRVIVDIEDTLRITSPEATTALFRICQEIVTNAARHAKATTLAISLRVRGDEARLEGKDDGGGRGPYEPGNGLIGIRERAILLGGHADFGRSESGGFRVDVCLPLARLA
jgi:signal transduction histidine kinase